MVRVHCFPPNGNVAQLDSASAYVREAFPQEIAEGCRFDSCRSRFPPIAQSGKSACVKNKRPSVQIGSGGLALNLLFYEMSAQWDVAQLAERLAVNQNDAGSRPLITEIFS